MINNAGNLRGLNIIYKLEYINKNVWINADKLLNKENYLILFR